MRLDRIGCTVLVLSLPVVGQDTPPLRWGISLGAVHASADLGRQAGGDLPMALGLLAEVWAGNGHLFVPRLDASRVAGRDRLWVDPSTGEGISFRTDARHFDLALDYNFFPAGGDRGLFLVGGVAGQVWRMETPQTHFSPSGQGPTGSTPSFQTTHSRQKTVLVPALGLGFRWNKGQALSLRHTRADMGSGQVAGVTTLEFRMGF